LLPREFPP
jgi:putative transposase